MMVARVRILHEIEQSKYPGEMPCQSTWVAKLFKSVGGKLIGWYLTFGHYDWLVIGEFPNEKAAASAMLAAAGGGSLSDVETTVAMTAKDAFTTFESAGKAAKAFRSAGRR